MYLKELKDMLFSAGRKAPRGPRKQSAFYAQPIHGLLRRIAEEIASGSQGKKKSAGAASKRPCASQDSSPEASAVDEHDDFAADSNDVPTDLQSKSNWKSCKTEPSFLQRLSSAASISRFSRDTAKGNVEFLN
jgi:hypothetical protein